MNHAAYRRLCTRTAKLRVIIAGDGLLALFSVTPTGLAVHGGQQSSWTVTVTDGSGATRTLSTGAPGDSDVDIPSDAVTLTLVSG